MKQLNIIFITFTLFLGIFINPIFCQNLNKNISELKLRGFYSVEYKLSIDIDKNDTTWCGIYMSFQNSEDDLTEIKSIYFTKKVDVEKFIKDLKRSVEYLGKKQDISFSGNGYRLQFYDFTKNLYIGDGKKSTIIYREKDLLSLINWLESLDLKYLNVNNRYMKTLDGSD